MGRKVDVDDVLRIYVRLAKIQLEEWDEVLRPGRIAEELDTACLLAVVKVETLWGQIERRASIMDGEVSDLVCFRERPQSSVPLRSLIVEDYEGRFVISTAGPLFGLSLAPRQVRDLQAALRLRAWSEDSIREALRASYLLMLDVVRQAGVAS